MALSLNGIGFPGREKMTTPGWSGRLLTFSAGLFGLLVVIYLGIAFGYTPYLQSQSQSLDDQAKKFGEQIPVADQANLINFYSQLADIKTILAKHIGATGFLGWLESRTVAKVSYSRFILNTATRQVSLSGLAKTMPDLAAQVQILENDPNVEKVVFNNTSPDASGNWQFDLSFTVKPELLAITASSPASSNLITPPPPTGASASSSTR